MMQAVPGRFWPINAMFILKREGQRIKRLMTGFVKLGTTRQSKPRNFDCFGQTHLIG